jgi:type II secretory pathway component PulL
LQENFDNMNIKTEEPTMPMPQSDPLESLKMYGSGFDREEQEIMMKKEKDDVARLDKLRVKKMEEDQKKKERISQGMQEFTKWNE